GREVSSDGVEMADDFKADLERALLKAFHGFAHITTMTRLSGGASQETWAMDVAAHDHLLQLILRRAPGGVPRATGQVSANSVPLETEAIVIEAARLQGVAAPRVRYVLKP